MPENDPIRVPGKIKEEIIELTRTVKALVKAIKAAEEETGEVFMPEGEYYGVKFEE